MWKIIVLNKHITYNKLITVYNILNRFKNYQHLLLGNLFSLIVCTFHAENHNIELLLVIVDSLGTKSIKVKSNFQIVCQVIECKYASSGTTF